MFLHRAVQYKIAIWNALSLSPCLLVSLSTLSTESVMRTVIVNSAVKVCVAVLHELLDVVLCDGFSCGLQHDLQFIEVNVAIRIPALHQHIQPLKHCLVSNRPADHRTDQALVLYWSESLFEIAVKVLFGWWHTGQLFEQCCWATTPVLKVWIGHSQQVACSWFKFSR